MGQKSNVIVEIETCHENKKLQLQSKHAAGLGRRLRNHKNPGELRMEGALETSSNLLGVFWAYSSFAPHFLSQRWPTACAVPTVVGTCQGEGVGIALHPLTTQLGLLSPSLLPGCTASQGSLAPWWHPGAFAAELLSSWSVLNLRGARGQSLLCSGLCTCPHWIS